MYLSCSCCGEKFTFASWLEKQQGTELQVNSNSTELEYFKLSTITVATNNFSPANKLGQGGFGSVYKV